MPVHASTATAVPNAGRPTRSTDAAAARFGVAREPAHSPKDRTRQSTAPLRPRRRRPAAPCGRDAGLEPRAIAARRRREPGDKTEHGGEHRRPRARPRAQPAHRSGSDSESPLGRGVDRAPQRGPRARAGAKAPTFGVRFESRLGSHSIRSWLASRRLRRRAFRLPCFDRRQGLGQPAARRFEPRRELEGAAVVLSRLLEVAEGHQCVRVVAVHSRLARIAPQAVDIGGSRAVVAALAALKQIKIAIAHPLVPRDEAIDHLLGESRVGGGARTTRRPGSRPPDS